MNAMAREAEAEIHRVLDALTVGHFVEFCCEGETFLIEPDNNKGCDYISIWRTGSSAVCLGHSLFDIFAGIDADAVSELLNLPCINGQSYLQWWKRGKLEWL